MRLLAAGILMSLLNLLSSSFSEDVPGDFSQRDALLALKRGFNDPVALASWNKNSFQSICNQWIGVTCQNNSSAVTKIGLPNTFRGGTILPAIGGLPYLQEIDLSKNFLSGSIPQEIGKLNNLTKLDLSQNLLTGSIPANWSGLTQLTRLNLWQNLLNGTIPAGLSAAVSLQYLRLENNSLDGEIPSQITLLGYLRYFAIEHNRLTRAFPKEIGRLTRLRSVYAAFNQLNGSLPESIINLTRLKHFELEGNQLSGSIPASFGNFTRSLLTLNLSSNNFSGQLPVALAKFPAASFANNRFLCGFPLTNCTSRPETSPPSPVLPEPPPSPRSPPRRMKPSKSTSESVEKIVGGTVGGVLGAFALLLILIIVIRCRSHRRSASRQDNWFSPDIQANRRKGNLEMFGRPDFEYTYEDLVSNAGFFDTAHVLGKGRYSSVYRSSLPDGTELAVKVLKFANVSANFEKEVRTLSSIRHQHILPIRGLYCNQVEKAIFYDYMPRGTLFDLLHKQGTHPSSLPDWAARQRIASGVAQALYHLHRGFKYLRFCHRDVKSTNVLLDSDLNPRLSDVGLTQLAASRHEETIAVVETPGYTAPEVLTTRKYSEKADVHSYGVVLMELVTGKQAVYKSGGLYMKDWVVTLHSEKRGREIMDPVAYQTCPFPEYLDRALDLAVSCVNINPNLRPSMSQVAGILEGLVSNPSPLRSPDSKDDKCLLPHLKSKV